MAAGRRLRRIVLLCCSILIPEIAHSQALRPEFWVPNGRVNTAVVSGNTLYIGGRFRNVGPPTQAIAKVDSSTGAALPVPEVMGSVSALESDGAGGWFLGGQFTAVEGVARQNLAHVDAAGQVTPWNPGVSGIFAQALTLKRSGDTLFVAGVFDTIAGVRRRSIAALSTVTGVALPWDPSAHGPIDGLIVTPTLVYASGGFDSIGGVRRYRLACVDRANGATTAFNPNISTNASIYGMQLGNGKLYVAGAYTSLGGASRTNIGAVDSTSGTATTWTTANGGGANGVVKAVILDGPYLYVGGEFTFITGASRFNVARLSSVDGACDQNWFGDAVSPIDELALSGNTLYAAGRFTKYGGAARTKLAALDVTTGLATPFSPNVSDAPTGIQVVPGALYLFGGIQVGGAARGSAAAFDLTTGALTSWNPLPVSSNPETQIEVYDLAVRGNTVYIAHDTGVQACDGTTGATKPWFVPINSGGFQYWVRTLALAGDTLYVGGSFLSLGGQSHNDLGSICVTNGTVGPWNPPTPTGGSVSSISVCGTTVYVAGDFTAIGAAPRAGIAAIGVPSGLVTTWNPAPSPSGASRVVATPTAVSVSGGFTNIGGASRNGLAVIDASTGFAQPFDAAADGPVQDFLAMGDLMYVSGTFANIGGGPHAKVACLDAVTGTARAFDVSMATVGTSQTLTALARGAGSLAIGGFFSDVAGHVRQNLAVVREPQVIAIGDRVRGELNSTTVPISVAVTLSPTSSQTVTVDWATVDGTATVADADYMSASGTVTFLPGETVKTISIGVVGDVTPEDDETFTIQLSNATGAMIADPQGVVTILDDDAGSVVCPELWSTDGTVQAVLSAGTTLYVGGTFSRVGPPTGGGVPIDASTGLPVAMPRPDREVRAAAPDGSGGWYIGGDFTHVGGVPRSYLAHIGSDGSVLPWDPGPNAPVRALLTAGDTVYVGGDFTSMAGVPRGGLASFHRVSQALTSWNPNTNGRVFALAVRSGVVYAGGSFGFAGRRQRNALVAADLSGNVTDWDGNAGTNVYAIAADDAAVYVGGAFSGVNGVTRRYLARLSRTTGIPLSFDPAPTAAVQSLALSGSRLFVAGAYDAIGGVVQKSLAAVDTASGLGSTWNPNVNFSAFAVAVSGGVVYAGGSFGDVGGTPRGHLAAIDANTAALLPWNPDANLQVNALAVSGGVVFAGGPFNLLGGTARNNLAQFDLGTGAVLPFDPNVNGTVYALERTKFVLYVGGAFTQVSGTTRNRLAALDTSVPAGSLLSWNPNANNTVFALELNDTLLYAGGDFTIVGNGALPNRSRAAAFGAAAGAILSWNPNANNTVNTILWSGTLVYLGGAFTTIGGQPRNRIASVQPTSGSFTTWNPNANGTVLSLASANNVVYAGGAFTSIGGQSRNRLAALGVSSATATAWNPNVNGLVNAVAVNGNRLQAGGQFSAVGGTARSAFAVLDTTTAALVGGNLRIAGMVNAISVGSGGKTYLGGQFTDVGHSVAAQIACLYGASPVSVELPRERGELALRLSPNPARLATAIEFELPVAAHVKVDVFDVAGRHVARLLDGDREPGLHHVAWNVGGKVGAGVYYVRLETAGRVIRRSLVLLQ